MKTIQFNSFPVIQKSTDFTAEKQLLDRLHINYEFVSKQTFLTLRHIYDFRLPEPGEQLRIRVQTQLNLTSIILKILEEQQEIDECSILSFSFNRESLNIFCDLIQSKKIQILNLYLASSYRFRDQDHYERLKTTILALKNLNIHLAFVPSHAKITLVKCGNNYFQMEGSMNFTTNTRVEHLLIENNRKSYENDIDFIQNWILKMNETSLEIVC